MKNLRTEELKNCGKKDRYTEELKESRTEGQKC